MGEISTKYIALWFENHSLETWAAGDEEPGRRERTYLNLTMAAGALELVLIALTQGRLGYHPEGDAVPAALMRQCGSDAGACA